MDRLGHPVAHRLAHGAEIAVEEKDHVVGQLVLGQGGKTADVGEQDRHLALVAQQVAGSGPGRAGRRGRRQERGYLEVRRRPGLTCQPDVGRGVWAAGVKYLVMGENQVTGPGRDHHRGFGWFWQGVAATQYFVPLLGQIILEEAM